MKILTIIGARPQIIKAAAISRAIKTNFNNDIQELILHTGQHYDHQMSEVFFDELGIPKPDFNLQAGSSSHGRQTAAMISGIEEVLEKQKPNAMVVYGDTNSTLAGAIAASKIHVPVVHIEAGLRSFNKKMPEEVNRILCDHVSTLLFSPTKAGVDNLRKEGFPVGEAGPYSADHPGVFHCGDIMYDNSLHFAANLPSDEKFLAAGELKKQPFILSTIHRNDNTDTPVRLNSIFRALFRIADQHGVLVYLPLHPRTAKLLKDTLQPELLKRLSENKVVVAPPASFLEMIWLEKNSELVLTDSGGVQKEAYFFNKPAVVLRDQTEWTELIENGNNLLAGADEERIVAAAEVLLTKKDFTYPAFFGDGQAATFICKTMLENLPR